MKKTALTILFIVAALATQAQRFSQEVFHPGKVVLASNDTIVGHIQYNILTNVLQVVPKNRSGKDAVVFNSQQVLYFDFDDTTLKDMFRQFISIPFDINNNNYDTPVLFELLYQGRPMTVLSREWIEDKVYTQSAYRSFSREELVYKFYFLKGNGEIIEFDGKKRTLPRIFGSYTDAVENYIKQERLKLDRIGDVIKMTAYYNKLSN